MERRETKRGWGEGCEMINSESEEKSSAKLPKLSERVMEKIDEDDDFKDLTPECSERPVSDEESEMMNLKYEEETSANQPKPEGVNEDFVHAESLMSDKWKYVNWQKCASSLWVVTKSPYSCDWIKDALKSEIFNEYKSDEKMETFKIDGDWKFRKSVSSCSCVVFCFESDGWDSESSREVEDLSSYYGLKNVIILLSEKTPDNCPPRQMNGRHKFPVLNFSKQQIAWYKDNLKLYNTKIEKMKTILTGSASWTGHKVGIFSRSSESEYEWLKMKLESEYFRGSVKNVQSYYISNRGFQQFMTNVSNCTFGILYHIKNRGRINITDVTDSLYDEELDYMSSMMNKNVIVVVDDLNDGNEEEKSRILSSQPSIKEKALDLFLFTTEEKKLLEPLVRMRNTINGEQQIHIYESCVLGKGGFGTVYKGSFNGTTVAIKKVICEENMRKYILLEVDLTMKLQHPNIVRCLAAKEGNGVVLLVLEYIPGANLHYVLHNQKTPIKLSEADKMSVCLDVLSAVDYTHSRNIIHQDIKPGNILIKEETKKALLTDWGAANIRITINSMIERSERIGPQGGGTLLYMAPERFLNRLARSTKMSDMWSVGATFVQLFTNRLPWEHPEEMYEKMRRNKLPRTLDFLPKNVYSIIKGSMSYKPEERLTANAMLSAMKAVKIMLN